MTYKAIMEIGDYKKGDVVPDEQAELWLKMYKVPPVEKVTEPIPEKKEEKEEPKKKKKKGRKSLFR